MPWRETTVNLSSSRQFLNCPWMIQEWKRNLLRKGKRMHLENGDSSGYPNLNPIACPEKHRKSVPTWPAPGCQPYLWDVMWYHLGWMKHPFSKNYTPPKTNMSPMDYFLREIHRPNHWFSGGRCKAMFNCPIQGKRPCSALWNITKTGSFSPLKGDLKPSNKGHISKTLLSPQFSWNRRVTPRCYATPPSK